MAAFLLLSFPACRGVSPSGDTVLLRLGDQVVRESDFERHLEGLREGEVEVGDDEVRQALLQRFLEERVLVLEARRRGLLQTPAVPEQEQRAVEELLAREVLSGIEVSEPEIEAYYAAHHEELRTPARVTVSQILVPTLNEARDLRRRLSQDKRSFELLARTRSQSPEGADGGSLGTFARGELPAELEAAAFQLQAGAFSGIVETPLGFHVLRLDAREEARERSLDECRDEIRSRLWNEAYDRATDAFVAELLAGAEVRHATN